MSDKARLPVASVSQRWCWRVTVDAPLPAFVVLEDIYSPGQRPDEGHESPRGDRLFRHHNLGTPLREATLDRAPLAVLTGIVSRAFYLALATSDASVERSDTKNTSSDKGVFLTRWLSFWLCEARSAYLPPWQP